jgi:hypothetical protein
LRELTEEQASAFPKPQFHGQVLGQERIKNTTMIPIILKVAFLVNGTFT